MANAADIIRRMNIRDLSAAAKSRKNLKRPPVMLFPYNAEREYVRQIRKLSEAMIGQVKDILIPGLPGILASARMGRPSADSLRLDEYDYDVELSKLMSIIRSNYSSLYSEAMIAALAQRIAEAVATQNGKELGKVFRSVLAVDPFISEPWLSAEMRAFVTQNVSLIKTLPERFFPAIEQKVFAAARQGISYKELMKDIKKTYGTTRYQAERIARDQVGKFNGQLSQLRQSQAGFDRYIWRTVRDDRVRDDHRVREGKIFSWKRPPFDGHPGEAIQCRCYAEPIIGDLLEYSEDE